MFGGAERSVLELARVQKSQGHQVAVAVGQPGSFSSALSAADVPWVDLGWSDRYVSATGNAALRDHVLNLPDLARAAAALRRYVRRWRPDVVQAHTRKSQLVSSLALSDVRVPLIWHLRDDLPARSPLRALISLALTRADHAVALSRWLAESYSKRGALPRSGRIGLVPSGVDPEPLARLPTPWLNGEREPVVGFIGQIAGWKAPHLLIDAAERLPHARASFRIIGSVSFPAAEDDYGRWLRARITGSPARHRLEWLPATDRAEDAFAHIDILAHTSMSPEPFGRVLVEAMVARRPIIALKRGSPAELLNDSTAIFAERADGKAFADAVASMIEDPGRARRMSERAMEQSARYRPTTIARLMDEEYARLAR
jgi:glycosyltransferase involved in cell wall biosynthesis